jgi:hypothetical protein
VKRSSGCGVGLAVRQCGQADTPDPPSPEEAAIRATEWRIELARRAGELDRRRRLRAVELELAEQEHRARRDAASREHAVRVELARDRRISGGGERTTVDLTQLDVRELRIVRL